ncbi:MULTISPECIES: glycoside hydrolase family 125 protein [unclassified Luteococcus]|uniref:glycoside hydrolase family 125 protein n=1 Tax=unclassified Luteococcus TaxID=2639923 RepID=UPI00313AE7A0
MPPHVVNPASPQVRARVAAEAERIVDATGEPRFGEHYGRLMLDTWQRTLQPGPDGVFVVTGDIPAMWLRDSSAQLRPWLALAVCPQIDEMVRGVVRMQWRLIAHDPYANAFNHPDHPASWRRLRHLLDNHAWQTRLDPWIWERKYEVDSLAFPMLLADALWKSTGDPSHLDGRVHRGLRRVQRVWRLEQDHQRSDYRFVRLGAALLRHRRDTLAQWGRGNPVGYTGMTWQGFRPSDDACRHGYHIPGNLMAAHALRLGARWCRELWSDMPLAADCERLAAEITAGVEHFAMLPDGGFAYEVDGLGGVVAGDDANLPSLLGLPLVAGLDASDPRYLATRGRILSSANPWWHQGTQASGIGSPHTPGRRIWPIGLAVQGLTSPDADERLRLARLLVDTTGGTGRMHESFHADDPSDFTRAWFSWADMTLCELLASL